jgi:hypothetical protein
MAFLPNRVLLRSSIFNFSRAHNFMGRNIRGCVFWFRLG